MGGGKIGSYVNDLLLYSVLRYAAAIMTLHQFNCYNEMTSIKYYYINYAYISEILSMMRPISSQIYHYKHLQLAYAVSKLI